MQDIVHIKINLSVSELGYEYAQLAVDAFKSAFPSAYVYDSGPSYTILKSSQDKELTWTKVGRINTILVSSVFKPSTRIFGEFMEKLDILKIAYTCVTLENDWSLLEEVMKKRLVASEWAYALTEAEFARWEDHLLCERDYLVFKNDKTLKNMFRHIKDFPNEPYLLDVTLNAGQLRIVKL